MTLKKGKEGRLMGLEPTTLGTTNRCSNQLSYNLHLKIKVTNSIVGIRELTLNGLRK